MGDIILYHHYNHLGSTTKLTDSAGNVVETYTYGTYGELLSGDATLTRFLYNGKLGVSTDDNGLFYMRQRYYNPEIKRFVNQDILAGTLDNSQSLNRYCYVQGNPVSYTDPFGLSPMSGQSGTNFAHTVLGFLSCIPGPFGMIASAIDAGVYAFVDKDYAMAALCMVDVVTFGMGKVATGMIKAGKMTKTGVALLKTSSMISNTVNFAVNVNAGANMAYGMYDKYIVQEHEFDSSTGWELLGLGLSILGGASSARGMTKDARHLGNLLSDADFTGGMKKELTQFASGVKDFYNNHKLNNYGFVDLSCFGFKTSYGKSSGNLSKKFVLKKNMLPTTGKIRFIPSKDWTASQPLKKVNGGFVDRFDNVWTKGPSRTAGEPFEWDVQLSKTGREKLGWLSRDNSHLNVSLKGEITHK